MDKQKYKRVTITLPNEILEEYQKFCINEGMNLSSRIAILIKRDLKKENGPK